MYRLFLFIVSVSIMLLPAGCASTPPAYDGFRFPVTDKVQVVFQGKDVPPQCKVFAHLIVHTSGDISGAEIGKRISKFAESKGADHIFVGLSRKTSDSDNDDFEFYSYGPKEVYRFGKEWFGWKFGYTDWEESKNIVGFGYNDWHDSKTIFPSGLKIQTVLLRCSQGVPVKVK